MRAPAREKAILVGVANRATPRPLAEEHLDELARLADTAGADVVGRFVKERAAPDPATYIGKGSVDEIGAAARRESARVVIFDDELAPAQVRNLEERWGEEIRVLDRPGLILDVFASHARTREARTQVELAQLQYLLPRLAGHYGHLSRMGGGIGGRGPGEQKLEVDRRKIRTRIARLRRELDRIETARSVRRRGRRQTFQVAIAGYTNAGKTTLFNSLTRESAYVADRLFATLDARVARIHSRELANVVVIDTVGFVRKLPTTLVASFRSTLAEIREADLVLHVLDLSSAQVDEERAVALELLNDLGVDPGRILTVWNKRDLVPGTAPLGGVAISASGGAGVELVKGEILRRALPGAGLFHAQFGDARAEAREGEAEKTKGGTVKLPPVPELPRRRSS